MSEEKVKETIEKMTVEELKAAVLMMYKEAKKNAELWRQMRWEIFRWQSDESG